MRALSILVFVLVAGGCGSSAPIGQCGRANQECCIFPDGTSGCNGPSLPTDASPLVCQGFSNGAHYCLPCGGAGQACCEGVEDLCQSGLDCKTPYPGANSGGICTSK